MENLKSHPDLSKMALMVKTILRPQALDRLLCSLVEHCPGAQVWIADDSPEPYPEVTDPYRRDLEIHYHAFDEDIGIGTCYNFLLDRIERPYICLLDDDFIFNQYTRLERFLPFLESGLFDLVGGRVYHTRKRCFQGFVGRFNLDAAGRTLRLEKIPQENVKGVREVEVTMNFWAATTESLRATRWDPALKVCRHEDFFLRYIGHRPFAQRESGYRVGFYPGVSVDHDNRSFYADTGERNNAYIALRRDRFPDFRQVFIQKWGFEFV